jgi:L-fuculose-phosphate aldolase
MTTELALRQALIETCRALRTSGLTFGTSGNVSARCSPTTCLISPTGMDYDALRPEDLPVLAFDGTWAGSAQPSSEWRFHRDILQARPEVHAIVHTHSTYATALACRGRAIPAFHYMVAVAGGADIRCAPYATFGTQALSNAALQALAGRTACLLANHGVIALGRDLPAALRLAGEVENLAHQYLIARTDGAPRLLDASEMQRVVEKFKTYGQPAGANAERREAAHGEGDLRWRSP